ncbi:MAG: 50S ribosomal protein L6 [Candidatus Marinimicrobia bacterium]|nr:50S ribosomal protein L6 [Candidatus Neomarinimicrobiota bacterium]
MSRIGKAPVTIVPGVTVTLAGRQANVKGPKGELPVALPVGIEVKVEDGVATVTRADDSARLRALHGTVRSLLANCVQGVSQGFSKTLEVEGVGYRVKLEGAQLVMSLGYSHPIEFAVPPGIQIQLPSAGTIEVSGCDKQQVGEVSARLRGFAPAEPYKGKGVKYKGERIRRKAGKTVA